MDSKQLGAFLQKITLKDLEFFAYHGFYPEEQVEGNTFFVTITVVFPVDGQMPIAEREDLNNAVNYEILYKCIEEEMQATKKLLETVCQAIMQRVLNEFKNLHHVEISIRKAKLPFGNTDQSTTVTLEWTH